MTEQTRLEESLAPVRHAVLVPAEPDQAFEVFTAGFGDWWPKTNTIAQAPVERAIIEPHVGGRCYDRCVDGSECDWGRVTEWDPPRRLTLAWQVDGSWHFEADPAHASRVTLAFVPQAGGTSVTLVHDRFERHTDGGAALADAVREGWGPALDSFAAAAAPGESDR